MTRLGSIEFVNSLPVDLGILNGSVPLEAGIISDVPAVLNQRILKKELEVSPVSAFFYAEHQKELLLLPDLSISSESGAQSVLLFSQYALKDLKGKKIALTGKGRTTPALLEILCRLRYGFEPNFVVPASRPEGTSAGASALLLIGDEALIARESWGSSGIQIIDLAEEWRAWTGCPLVFAVWAARRDFFAAKPKETADVHETLLKSKAWGAEHLDEIVAESERRTGLPRPVLTHYFSSLSYGFGADLQKAMRLFFGHAAQCGLLGPVGEFENIGRQNSLNLSLQGVKTA